MKKILMLCLLLVAHSQIAYADQMDERMARAAAIQEAEENNKLCQLGSPSCKGQFSGAPAGLQTGRGAPTMSGLPTLPGIGAPYVPAIGNGAPVLGGDAEIADPLARPKTVGLSIVGGQRVAEVRFQNKLVTMREGETLGVWTLANLSENGASWGKTKSTKTKPVGKQKTKAGQRVVAKPKLVHDLLGNPSFTTPVTIK